MTSKVPGGELAIELQLRKEQVGALKLVANALEKSLAELARLRVAWAGGDRSEKISTLYAQRWRDAEKHRWHLIVQREAMGIRNQRVVDEVYPLPPKRLDASPV